MDSMTVSLAKTVVRAGTSFYGSASFFQGASPDTPTSVSYRVTTPDGTVIRDWTAAVPNTSSSVILENEDTALLVATDLKEYRIVTFRAVKSPTTLEVSETYLITNLGYQSVIVSLGAQVSPVIERYLPLPSSRISRNVELDNWNP
jgi:hypothetical protein